MLQFLGRGSAFADEQNCAFFEADGQLILLDCPMSAFHRIRHFQKQYDGITVLVTHTHSDHCGGIPMLIHYAKHVFCIPVTVIAPMLLEIKELKPDYDDDNRTMFPWSFHV